MLIKTRWIGVGFAIGLALGAAGCGGDDDDTTTNDGSGGTSGSNHPGSGGHGAAGQSSANGGTKVTLPAGTAGKKLSELSPAEAMQTCEAIAQQASAAISDEDAERLACTLLGVVLNIVPGSDGMATVDVAKCKQSVEQCVMQGGGSATTQYNCDPSQFPTQIMDCDASATELSACIDASLAATQMLLDEVRCDNVSSMPSGALQGMQTAPECQALQAKCPGLDLGGSSGSTAPSPTGCDDTCSDANDGFCDDGGPRSESSFCGLGTDCADCGAREMP